MVLAINNSKLDIDQLKDHIQCLAKKNNVIKWDLGAIISNDLSVQVDNGEAKQLKASQRNSITIRVWNQSNTLGITTTSDFTKFGIEKAFKGALEASFYGNTLESPEFSSKAKEELPQLPNPIKKSVGINKLLETLKEAEASLINFHKYIDSIPYNGLSEANAEKIYLNSDGASRQMNISQASIFLYAKGQSEGKKPRSGGSVKVGYGLEDINIEECIKESANKLISHIDYRPIVTSKYLVCFSPEAFLDLIGAFSNIFNARSILDGVSLSTKESIDSQISVPFLSLSDEALHPDNIGVFTFDGEGTPKKNIQLIHNGILKNLLHSEATAREFNVDPTGHASLGSKASVSPDWFVIKKSNKSTCKHNDLNTKDFQGQFVLIENLNALHAGVKASQGSFSLPFDGWLVDSGQKTSIEAATVAGGIKELLLKIIQIEENLISTHQGVSPYIWVEGLSITGEA